MPELPDIELYVHCLRPRMVGQKLVRVRPYNPFIVRSVEPPASASEGLEIRAVSRIGKRIVLSLESDLHWVLHLMIAGRLRWTPDVKALRQGGRIASIAFDFEHGQLTLTEASSHKRASAMLVSGRGTLDEIDPGGLNLFKADAGEFRDRLLSENRTLKRALTNPRWFDGIGNAYSDEILHAARLSPLRLTQSLSDEETVRLHGAAQETLKLWTVRLKHQFSNKFPGPGDVTAFRPDFAVHGKFGKPCPECGKPVQRIRYAENETNYCAVCQNEGRLFADRGLSRLLKEDWPKTLEEMLGER